MMPDTPPAMSNQMNTMEIQSTAVDESPAGDENLLPDVRSGLLPLRSLQQTAQEQVLDGRDGLNSPPESLSLSDKLKILEDRLAQLEKEPIPRRSSRSDSDSERDVIYDQRRPVEHTVKFFPMFTFFGDYQMPRVSVYRPLPQREMHIAPPGAYACEEDTQHFIRVAYEPVLPAMSTHDSNPPSSRHGDRLDPAHIADILTFSVVSNHIASFFGQKLAANSRELSVGGIDGHAIVRFGKPFRPVLHHLDSMRKQLEELERSIGHTPISANSPRVGSCYPDGNREPESPVPDTDAEPDSVSKNKERLSHFQTFIEFVDKYLADQIQLYQNLRARRLETVTFENLWMLFDHQDTIYCPVREARKAIRAGIEDIDEFCPPVIRHIPQAYRVIGTEGGMPTESWQPTVDYSSFADSKTMIQSNQSVALETASGGTRGLASRIRRIYTDLHVHCYFIDFDGAAYGRVLDSFVFKPYEGEMEIRTLQVHPIDYATGNNLADRGYKFMDATTVSHRQYEGLTVGTSREEINSPVIVDVKSAFEVGSSMGSPEIQAPDFAKEPRYSNERPPHAAVLGCARNIYSNTSCPYPRCQRDNCTDDAFRNSVRRVRRRAERDLKLLLGEQELYKERHAGFKQKLNAVDLVRLLPGAVPAYALRNRKWVLLDLNLLKPIKQNHEWKNLVLPKGHRKMVQAMVETHTNQVGSGKDNGTKTVGMDIVQGKGRGCIILLHGVPGVGKTSTAECVAAHTNKPLYPITCGDIGYRPEDLERNMENHFRLAHRWGCVLLLDEADVFLAKRDQRDVQRNGLVSVFLRILEYYSGILFLTTNRVGAIDDAFRSRLHLTLYYPKINKEQTAKIFKRNFKRIEDINKDREKHGLLPFECPKTERKAVTKWAQETWKKLRWNGRQIRNTFQTVLALAEFDARGTDDREPTNPVVTKGHFRIVASASVQFNEYLKQTHGFDEDRIAKRDFIRAEDFSIKLEESSSETESSSSEDSDLSYESGTDGDSEESEDDSDDDKKKKKGSKLKEKEKKDKKGKTGRSGAKTASKKVKKTKGDGDGKKKGDKKTKEKEKKKKSQEGEGGVEDDSESDSDDSEP